MPMKDITNIVVVMLENRSFDSVLGYLYGPQDLPAVNMPPLRADAPAFRGLSFADASTLVNGATINGVGVTQAPVPGVRASTTPGFDPGEEFAHANKQLFGQAAVQPPTQPHVQDPNTGLYWLLLTETLNQTYSEVEQKLAPGGPLAAWRRATAQEVRQLFANHGVPMSADGPRDAIAALISKVGLTSSSRAALYAGGFVANPVDLPPMSPGTLYRGSANLSCPTPSFSTPSTATFGAQDEAVGFNSGHWLVLKTVPMNGFLQDYADTSSGAKPDVETVRQVMHGYTPADLPVLNTLARGYAVCDEWFSSVPTQTNANRAFSLCGTSMGLVDNGYLTTDRVAALLENDRFPTNTLFNVLHDHGFDDWTIFWESVYPPVQGTPPFINSYPYTRNLFSNLKSIPDLDGHFRVTTHATDGFFARAEAGTLPALSYIEPAWGGAVWGGRITVLGNDYHPPSDTTTGEAFLRRIYRTLAKGPRWKSTLLVILFDEHGGTFDHVPPPWGAQPPWGDMQAPPSSWKPLQYGFRFDRYGVRVPAILVSPLIEQSVVFRAPNPTVEPIDPAAFTPFDHTSVIATVLQHFLPNVARSAWGLGPRVANAPTFDSVVTRSTPRTDDVFASSPANTGDPVNFGQAFFLRHSSGKFVGPANARWFDEFDLNYYPELSASSQTLSFRNGWGPVSDGASVQLRTDELLTPELTEMPSIYFAGIRNMLGAWSDQHDCYYFTSVDNQPDNLGKQSWKVSKTVADGHPLRFGDVVALESQAFAGRRLAANGIYLTVTAGATDTWTILPARRQSGRFASSPPSWNEAPAVALLAASQQGGTRGAQLWAVDLEGQLRSTFQQSPGGPWSPWSGIWNGSSPANVISVAAAQLDDGRVMIWLVDANYALYSNAQTSPGGDWTGWVVWSGAPALTLIAAAQQGGPRGAQLWGVDTQGQLRSTFQAIPEGQWSSWSGVWNGSSPLNAISIATVKQNNGRVRIWVIDSNRALYSNEQTAPGGDWSGWSGPGWSDAPLLSVIAAAQQGGTGGAQLWGVDSAGFLRSTVQQTPGGPWSPWSDIWNGASPTNVISIAAAQQNDGTVRIWVVDADQVLYSNQQSTPGGAWTGWVPQLPA